jgi:hypothetical protein
LAASHSFRKCEPVAEVVRGHRGKISGEAISVGLSRTLRELGDAKARNPRTQLRIRIQLLNGYLCQLASGLFRNQKASHEVDENPFISDLQISSDFDVFLMISAGNAKILQKQNIHCALTIFTCVSHASNDISVEKGSRTEINVKIEAAFRKRK